MSMEYRIEEFLFPFGAWYPFRELGVFEDLEAAKAELNRWKTQYHRKFRLACREVGEWRECRKANQ